MKSKSSIPICKKCSKKVPTNAKIIVNPKTFVDYRLCSSCYFSFVKTTKTNVLTSEPTIHDYTLLTNREKYLSIKTIMSIDTLRAIIQQEKRKYRLAACKTRIKQLARS